MTTAAGAPEPGAGPDDALTGLLAGLRQLGTELPFNRHLGVEVADLTVGRCTTRLPEDARLANHVGSVHAIAELAPVELAGALAASSRLAVLLERGLVPVVRTLEVRYHAPGRGALTATAEVGEAVIAPALTDLEAGLRPRVAVDVEVRDDAGAVVVAATVGFSFVPAAG